MKNNMMPSAFFFRDGLSTIPDGMKNHTLPSAFFVPDGLSTIPNGMKNHTLPSAFFFVRYGRLMVGRSFTACG
jgi:hypothetical protein